MALLIICSRRMCIMSQCEELKARRTRELVGRQDELERVLQALGSKKVVVIHGGPGEGKSRLAAEAASRLPGHRHAFVDLGGMACL
jgi:MoxR-like ATPase